MSNLRTRGPLGALSKGCGLSGAGGLLPSRYDPAQSSQFRGSFMSWVSVGGYIVLAEKKILKLLPLPLRVFVCPQRAI